MTTLQQHALHPAKELQTMLLELDAMLHDVLQFVGQPRFDTIEATRVMDRFDSVYHTLDRRFCWLLLELEEDTQAPAESDGSTTETGSLHSPADSPTQPPAALEPA